MKNLLTLILLLSSVSSFAGKDISSSEVVFVYQPDLNPNEFEFNSTVPNGCGSNLYRVVSEHESIGNRKFSIVLTAFTVGNKLAFHDKQTCVSGRSLVG